MRRAVPAIILTILGLGALASFQTSPISSKPLASASAVHTRTTTPPASAPPATAPPATAPPATAPPATQSLRTVDGDPAENQYGIVQVRVTLRGNKIVDIVPLQMPTDHARSAYITQQVTPWLHDEVIQAQSAQIDLISGATYTSDSYATSLQSALDKAHQQQ